MPFVCDLPELGRTLTDIQTSGLFNAQPLELFHQLTSSTALLDKVVLSDAQIQDITGFADVVKQKLARLDNDVEIAALPFLKQREFFAPYVKVARAATDAVNSCHELPAIPLEFL